MGEPLTVALVEVDGTRGGLVGGKAAHLGELSRVDGVLVPGGFCVTTEAFRQGLAALPQIDVQLDRLSSLGTADQDEIPSLSAGIRSTLESAAVPSDVEADIMRSLAQFGPNARYAVRSSATAEDSPMASFAGQHDTYLNVVGSAQILERVRRCWASLFTERAVRYRVLHGVEHPTAEMAVIVQQMLSPVASGVLFTADPVTSNRTVVSIEATLGLAEALVSGLANPDVYKVRDGRLSHKTVATKDRAVHASPEGGTHEVLIDPERQRQPALTETQILQLADLGRRIEAHFGCPQDIEWCLADDTFHILQSRPITTLFPIPQSGDRERHVYISVGHQQMMTDAMTPLGLSLWQLTAARPMYEAGGRLFVDVTKELASSNTSAEFVEGWQRYDPLTGDALRTIAGRPGFLPVFAEESPRDAPAGSSPPPPPTPPAPPTDDLETDSTIVTQLIQRGEASLDRLRQDIQGKSGTALLAFILADLSELKAIMFDPPSPQVIRAAMHAASWLNEHMATWLGERNAADALTQSAPDNVTSEMGLALLDVADAIRPHGKVVALLGTLGPDESVLDVLSTLPGGSQAKAALDDFLERYGMRCAGEIDITRPRWSEHPALLLPMILANVEHFEPGAGVRRFEEGLNNAVAKTQDLTTRLRPLPDGEQKAAETKAMIDRLRTFVGYREYPKYHMVSRYFVYKTALLKEAERLLERHVLQARDDIFYLTIEELHEALRTDRVNEELVRLRRHEFRRYEALTPPRVLTSEGEVVSGRYERETLPHRALIGLPVSSGTVEGRARVVLDVAEADLDPGDILVTRYTDPSWTPLFVMIAGLVTEVGGLMTHGVVIAREYGLPAVVGVEGATRLIRDGRRIRLNGTEGYVEILP